MARQRIRVVAALSVIALLQMEAARADESDGARVVGESCSSCHQPGLMGAPKIGDTADWQSRLKKSGSVAALLASTQHGKGNMPARGGESSLSDAELQSAIQYMLTRSSVPY
jgi:cytochrome c5